MYLEPYQTPMMQTRPIIDIWKGSLQPRFLIFSTFPDLLRLYTWINIWAFCFSSESVQIHSSRDVNQICNMFYWFPNHSLYIDHKNTKFSYIYAIKMQKGSLWKKIQQFQQSINTLKFKRSVFKAFYFWFLLLPNL